VPRVCRLRHGVGRGLPAPRERRARGPAHGSRLSTGVVRRVAAAARCASSGRRRRRSTSHRAARDPAAGNLHSRAGWRRQTSPRIGHRPSAGYAAAVGAGQQRRRRSSGHGLPPAQGRAYRRPHHAAHAARRLRISGASDENRSADGPVSSDAARIRRADAHHLLSVLLRRLSATTVHRPGDANRRCDDGRHRCAAEPVGRPAGALFHRRWSPSLESARGAL
jgi:hypothetical protein